MSLADIRIILRSHATDAEKLEAIGEVALPSQPRPRAARSHTMNVKHGQGRTEYGPGVDIDLTGDEVATAIDAYLVAHGIHVSGPRTVTVNGKLCESGRVYVDPSGFVIAGGEKYSGRGVEYEMVPGPKAAPVARYGDDSTDPGDLVCARCGLPWPDRRETKERHECPPGFKGPARRPVKP